MLGVMETTCEFKLNIRDKIPYKQESYVTRYFISYNYTDRKSYSLIESTVSDIYVTTDVVVLQFNISLSFNRKMNKSLHRPFPIAFYYLVLLTQASSKNSYFYFIYLLSIYSVLQCIFKYVAY